MDQHPDFVKLLADMVRDDLSMPGTMRRRDEEIPDFVEEMAIFSLLCRTCGDFELAQSMVEVAAKYGETSAGAKAWNKAQKIIATIDSLSERDATTIIDALTEAKMKQLEDKAARMEVGKKEVGVFMKMVLDNFLRVVLLSVALYVVGMVVSKALRNDGLLEPSHEPQS